MNLKRCNNGHFYDADKFETCPYCNPTVSASELTVAMDQAQMYGDTADFDEEEGKTVSLQDAVSAAVSAPEPAASAAAAARDLDDSKTVSYYAQSMGTDPVVGWLVCIEGSYFGKLQAEVRQEFHRPLRFHGRGAYRGQQRIQRAPRGGDL